MSDPDQPTDETMRAALLDIVVADWEHGSPETHPRELLITWHDPVPDPPRTGESFVWIETPSRASWLLNASGLREVSNDELERRARATKETIAPLQARADRTRAALDAAYAQRLDLLDWDALKALEDAWREAYRAVSPPLRALGVVALAACDTPAVYLLVRYFGSLNAACFRFTVNARGALEGSMLWVS